MLKIEHLYKSYGSSVVLKDINFEINKNERVVIIGPSGSGKSTLLRCINLITKPTSGSVVFEGVELTNKNITKYRQKIGMVFQNYSLFNNLNVINNIMILPRYSAAPQTRDVDYIAIAKTTHIGFTPVIVTSFYHWLIARTTCSVMVL